MSRWTMPAACSPSSPARIWRNPLFGPGIGHRTVHQHPPATRPRPIPSPATEAPLPGSSPGCAPRWGIEFPIDGDLPRKASRLLSSPSGNMTLSANSPRGPRSTCHTRNTRAMPPSPSVPATWYGPIRVSSSVAVPLLAARNRVPRPHARGHPRGAAIVAPLERSAAGSRARSRAG